MRFVIRLTAIQIYHICIAVKYSGNYFHAPRQIIFSPRRIRFLPRRMLGTGPKSVCYFLWMHRRNCIFGDREWRCEAYDVQQPLLRRGAPVARRSARPRQNPCWANSVWQAWWTTAGTHGRTEGLVGFGGGGTAGHPFAMDALRQAMEGKARCSFAVPREYILYLDEEKLFANIMYSNSLPLSEGTPSRTEGELADSNANQKFLPCLRGGGPRSGEGVGEALENISYPETYKEIPYDTIVEVLEDRLGGKPALGGRNNFIFTMACHLRHICDDNPYWIAQVLPRYEEDTAVGGLPSGVHAGGIRAVAYPVY